MRFLRVLSVFTLVYCAFNHAILAQDGVLNEDFATTGVTQQPADWANIVVSGQATDLWHFDNPAQRTNGYPIDNAFAIFDHDAYSNDGLPEEAILQTKIFDASAGSFCYLFFDYNSGVENGAQAIVEVQSGATWVPIDTLANSGGQTIQPIYDISEWAAGITNARVRFRWKSNNGSGFWAIDNVNVLLPLPLDADLTSFLSPQVPFNEGFTPIEVNITNQGANTIQQVVIAWTLNGISQPNVSWNGNLAYSQSSSAISLGSFTSVSGQAFTISANIISVNGTSDFNTQNNTLEEEYIPALCGTYTLGGQGADFPNFTEAAYALNTFGVACPVTILVNDGTYNEQVTLYEFQGSSDINTVTFQGASGDSSLAILNFNTSNTVNNHTLALSGTRFITLRNLSIISSNENPALYCLGGTQNLLVEYCSLSNIVDPVSGNDAHLYFKNNNISDGFIRFDPSPNNGSTCSNILIENNTLKQIFIEACDGVQIIGNSIIDCDYMSFQLASNLIIRNNNIEQSATSGSLFYIYQLNNIAFVNNNIQSVLAAPSNAALMQNTFTVNCKIINNYIDCNHAKSGIDITLNTQNNGIYYPNNDTIQNNTIVNTTGYAININERSNAFIANNRLLNVINGTAIISAYANLKIVNNYIQCTGNGEAKGISIRNLTYYTNINQTNTLLHNSINITSADPSTGRALEIIGGQTAVIKNNIFANNGGGYAAYISPLPPNLTIDYNNYYSTGNDFGYINGTEYSSIATWGPAVSGDNNSLEVNPLFASDIDLQPYSFQIENTGTDGTGVVYDIDGEVRNSDSPDIGAQEYTLDFGIVDLLAPTLNCLQTDSESVTILARQYGDVPFIDLQIAYQLNNGQIFYDTIPGAPVDDIEFTFNNPVDLSQQGDYLFRIWLVNNVDNNANNDTLELERFSKPAPVVDFTYTTQCANVAVPFNGTASISVGSIAAYEWDFGDNNLGVGANTAHIYDTAAVYPVSLRAYSNEGCYSEVIKNVSLLPTPDAQFDAANGCLGSSVAMQNQTQILNGAGTPSYLWQFGNGATAASTNPSHLYASTGTYQILLTASNTLNGCTDTISRYTTINALPVATFTIPSLYAINQPSFALTGTPSGGTFSGPGVISNVFAPILAGVGAHTITYAYVDPITGCSTQTTNTIQVVGTTGCTDPNALNYNPLALSNDGSESSPYS